MDSSAAPTIQNSKFKTHNWITILFWLVTGLAVTLLCLRFGLRFVGVRQDTPFAGFIFGLTAPAVTPFYRLFPVSDRFDYYAVEWAALVATGCVLILALALYAAALLLSGIMGRVDRSREANGSRS